MTEKTIYLNSGGCAWGKCIFCGWGKRSYPKLNLHQLKRRMDEELQDTKADTLKIFNSGSFLDENQIPRAFRSYVVRLCERKGIKNIVIESRPEFIDHTLAEDMKSRSVRVTIGIGLEVADDRILKKLNKGLTVRKYLEAAKFLRENGFGVRSYILVNAPFTTKRTLDRTVNTAEKYSDSIVLLNWFPHGKSEAFELWLRGRWKPLAEKEFRSMTKKYRGRKIEKDFANFVFTPRFPVEEWIRGAGEKQLLNPVYEVWQEFICKFHERPRTKTTVLFVPCAYRKPYFNSRLHKAIFSVIGRREDLHVVALSSPGVIPYEFVNRYPFNRYDWPEWEETPEIKKLYIKVTQRRIENYLRTHKYKKYYSYLKPTSESSIALERACKKLRIKLIKCLKKETFNKIKNEKNPLSLPEALSNLRNCLRK